MSVPVPTDAPPARAAAEDAAVLMLAPAEVPPADTWEAGGRLETGSFPVSVCGVATEPVPPPSGVWASQRHNPDGDVLYQSIRPVGATQATVIVDELAAALPACTEYQRSGVPEGHRMVVEPVGLVGTDTVAWAEADLSEPDLWYVTAFFVERNSLVVLRTVRLSADQSLSDSTTIVADAVTAVREKSAQAAGARSGFKSGR